MTAEDASIGAKHPRRSQDDRLKDEVYRHMFRLEAKRPGADVDLATALVRGWLDAETGLGRTAMREWLRKICPICLRLIEASQQTSEADQRCNP